MESRNSKKKNLLKQFLHTKSEKNWAKFNFNDKRRRSRKSKMDGIANFGYAV